MTEAIVFSFNETVPVEEIEGTLRLARLAVEALHGAERVRLEAQHAIARGSRTVTITVTNEVGKTLALVFGGYARREFGDDAVSMERTSAPRKGNPVGTTL